MIDLLEGGGVGGGTAMQAAVMGLDKKIVLDYMVGRAGNGSKQHGQGRNSMIPFVGRKTRLTKEAMEAALVKTSDKLVIASGSIDVIRANAIVRQFPWNFAGSSQILAPTVIATISAHAPAGNPGFARSAANYYEFTAAYQDAAGTTPASNITTAATDENSTVHTLNNYVFVATSAIGNAAWATTGDINTESTWPETTVVPYDSTSNKEVAGLVLPAKTLNSFSNLTVVPEINPAPAGFTGGHNVGWTMNCEVCFGLPVGGNNFVRTSPITVITPSQGKDFYQGLGYTWDQDSYSGTLVGRDQLLRSASDAKVHVRVRSAMYWRPVGQTNWSMSYSFYKTNATFVSNYMYIPNPNTFVGSQVAVTILPAITRCAELNISYKTWSKPLGIVNKGAPFSRVYRLSGDGSVYRIAPTNDTSYVQSYATNASWSDTAAGTPGGTGGEFGMVKFGRTLNLADDAAPGAKLSPTGDQFFTEGERIRINLAVPLNAAATGVQWFVRTVTKSGNGNEARSSWSRINGSGFSNQYMNTLTANVTPPATNTTTVRSGSYDGVIGWNDANSDVFDLLVGDQVFVTNVSVDGPHATSLIDYYPFNGPTGNPLGHIGTYRPYQWLHFGFDVQLLE